MRPSAINPAACATCAFTLTRASAEGSGEANQRVDPSAREVQHKPERYDPQQRADLADLARRGAKHHPGDEADTETIIVPTTTSAAAATSEGTISAKGVKNIAAKKSPPVTRLARPVRAPSPIPAPDSMNTVFDDADTAPPAAAPTPSTTRAAFSRGKLPCSSNNPAWRDRPVKVPIASKKLLKTNVKTSMTAARMPMRLKLFQLNWPTNDSQEPRTVNLTGSARTGSTRADSLLRAPDARPPRPQRRRACRQPAR